jgi:NAD(P)-dependent dehydrogenase (short-subunit alcohol dehydrogenase family)
MVRVSGLEDRVAVVTGAAGGIGREIVVALAANGARVAGLDLVRPAYDGVVGYECDVSDEKAVDAAFAAVEADLGPATVLVLNAGIFPITPFEEISVELWNRTLATNLTGGFLCARRALPGMRAAGYGRVLGIGSTAGRTGGVENVAAYAASKAGIMTLVKSIATEYAPYGITSNALAPAFIETEMIRERREYATNIPVGRLGRPEEVAAVAVLLCSAEAAYMTGEILDINGGLHID